MRLTVALLLLWEACGRLLFSARLSRFLPIPTDVIAMGVTLLRNGELIDNVLHSAGRVAVGGGIGVLSGAAAGVVLAAGRLGRVLEAPLALLRPVPPIAWIPLTILWFGVSEAQQVAILAGATFHVVAPGCADAARRVPPSLLQAATNLGASRLAVAGVRARAALPGVLTAAREGVAVAWLVVVAAEFVSAPSGLGVLVLEGRDLLQPARTFLGMALLASCGALSDAGLRWVQQRISPAGLSPSGLSPARTST